MRPPISLRSRRDTSSIWAYCEYTPENGPASGPSMCAWRVERSRAHGQSSRRRTVRPDPRDRQGTVLGCASRYPPVGHRVRQRVTDTVDQTRHGSDSQAARRHHGGRRVRAGRSDRSAGSNFLAEFAHLHRKTGRGQTRKQLGFLVRDVRAGHGHELDEHVIEDLVGRFEGFKLPHERLGRGVRGQRVVDHRLPTGGGADDRVDVTFLGHRVPHQFDDDLVRDFGQPRRRRTRLAHRRLITARGSGSSRCCLRPRPTRGIRAGHGWMTAGFCEASCSWCIPGSVGSSCRTACGKNDLVPIIRATGRQRRAHLGHGSLVGQNTRRSRSRHSACGQPQ